MATQTQYDSFLDTKVPKNCYLSLGPNGSYYFVKRIPYDDRPYYDNREYISVNLETSSLTLARSKRDKLLTTYMKVDRAKLSKDNSRQAHVVYKNRVMELLTFDEFELERMYIRARMLIDKLISENNIQPDFDGREQLLLEMPVIQRRELIERDKLKKACLLIEDAALRSEYQAITNAFYGVDHSIGYISMLEALSIYMENKEGVLKRNTLTQAKKSVMKFLDFLRVKDIALRDIRRRDVKTFIEQQCILRSNKTVKAYISFLNQMWAMALDLELVSTTNPFEKHSIDTTQVQSYQLFTEDELDSIFRYTRMYKSKQAEFFYYMVPKLGYVTGCRIEELCSLSAEQIHLDEQTKIVYIEILDGKTKNAERTIPIHDALSSELMTLRKEIGSGPIFPQLKPQLNDGKYSDKVSKSFARMTRFLGMRERSKSFHSLRVNMATNLERGGVPESTAVWILGHTRNLSLSYGLYSKGVKLEQLKNAIDTIPIPTAFLTGKRRKRK